MEIAACKVSITEPLLSRSGGILSYRSEVDALLSCESNEIPSDASKRTYLLRTLKVTQALLFSDNCLQHIPASAPARKCSNKSQIFTPCKVRSTSQLEVFKSCTKVSEK